MIEIVSRLPSIGIRFHEDARCSSDSWKVARKIDDGTRIEWRGTRKQFTILVTPLLGNRKMTKLPISAIYRNGCTTFIDILLHWCATSITAAVFGNLISTQIKWWIFIRRLCLLHVHVEHNGILSVTLRDRSTTKCCDVIDWGGAEKVDLDPFINRKSLYFRMYRKLIER